MKKIVILILCLAAIAGTAMSQAKKKETKAPVKTQKAPPAKVAEAKKSTKKKKAVISKNKKAAAAKGDTAKAAAPKPKPLTAYQKLFKGKNAVTKQGMITLHKIEGKVYFEFPKKLLEKPMLVGSVVESVSNSNDAVAGEQAHDPLCVYFSQVDSTVHMRAAAFANQTDKEDTGLQNALNKNNIGAVISSFKILAVSPDSTSVVFNATEFFVSGNPSIDPFMPVGGLNGRTTSYKSGTSLLDDIMAYQDNVSVTSYLSFGITSTFFGFTTEEDRAATIQVKRTLVLLPEKPVRPRISDPRIGVFFTRHFKYSGKDNGMKAEYFANRWNLEPKDMDAFNRGGLSEPVKPVVFYIDTEFPKSWLEPIKAGVADWNKAFEAIGFKNAIVTRMYPKNDPNFDPNNTRYNCIKYAPTLTQNAMGPSWVDPRSGEILNASVYIYHGITDILSQWMFLQTAAADKRARAVNMPPELMGQALRYVTAHEIGHCLGLMHNMGASSAFPVDSLRSPSFTQKYGTTPSIMDYARFNFVAQPGDFEKGVKMTPPDLGVYDYYAIKWLYRPIPEAKTPAAEVPVLEKWISEKIADPMYRYSRQQVYGIIDPNAQTEDLGDDQVKATAYAYENLKYIMKNMNGWVAKDDKDFSFRKTTNFAIINIQFYWYLMHVLPNIGGVYQYEKYEGDPFPAYRSVPRETQQKSMLFVLDVLENLEWLNDAQAGENIDGINGDASEYMRSILFPYVMRWVGNIGFSANKAVETPYTRDECVADVFNYIWGGTSRSEKLTKEKLSLQTSFVQLLIRNSGVLKAAPQASAEGGFNLNDEDAAIARLNYLVAKNSMLGMASSVQADMGNDASVNNEVSGFGFLPRIAFQTSDMSDVYYDWLLKSKSVIEKNMGRQNGDAKTRYKYLLLQINRALRDKQ